MCQNRFILSYVLLWVLSLFVGVNMDVFSAVSQMQVLANVEWKMVIALRQYVTSCNTEGLSVPDSVKLIKQKIVDLKLTTERPDDDMSNPINAFHLIKRIYIDWAQVLSDINCNVCANTNPRKKFNKKLEAIPGVTKLQPTLDDYKGTALALVRLWQTYKLDLTKLFRGSILNSTSAPLKIEDILFVCQVLDEMEDYYSEVKWLEELYRNVVNDSNVSIFESSQILRQLASAYGKYGMPWVAEQLVKEQLENDPNNEDLKTEYVYFSNESAHIPEENRTLDLKPNDQLVNALNGRGEYEALCRGEGVRPVRVVSRLKCYIRRTEIPIYQFKEEVFNYAPRVSVFYDVISEDEQTFLKAKGGDHLATSKITAGPNDNKNMIAYVRVSQTAWLYGKEDPTIQRLNHRVSLITGLSTEARQPVLQHSEPFQVLNYGIGGMYEPHLDKLGTPIELGFSSPKDPPHLVGTGDRIATFMFYLSDVIFGGATVFMNINITVPAVKGSALFWYNYKRNGAADHETYHAGCPVLLGSKWVSNKWIRQEGQVFRRKCGLTENSIDGPV